MNLYQYLLTTGILLAASYTDLRERSIPVRLTVLYFLSAALGYALLRDCGLMFCLGGLLPGSICLLFSVLSRQMLGLGDSLLIMILGLSIGAKACISVLFLAFLGAGIRGFFLLLCAAGERKSEIAFVPFLLAAVLILGIFVTEGGDI